MIQSVFVILAPTTSPRVLRALYEYKSHIDGDLTFHKGDLLELVALTTETWWLARHPDGTEGYIPSNYVALENTIESKEYVPLSFELTLKYSDYL